MFKKIFLTTILFFSSLPASFALITPLNNCSSLAHAKTVLLVHASWCKHCQNFMPIYINASNEKKYKGWKFYHVEDDNFQDVCGKKIESVPATFSHNMQKVVSGGISKASLEEFLDAN